MKRYMLLVENENNEVAALFYDNYKAAERDKTIGEKCFGHHCELYRRKYFDLDHPDRGGKYISIE